MNKWLKFSIIGSILLVTLTGCQLAHAEASKVSEGDQLVGMFITQDHVDTYDMEQMLDDNGMKIARGGDIVFSNDYNGKIYGTLLDDDEGDVYEFGDLEGVLFMDTTYTDDEGGTCIKVTNNERIFDVSISSTDEGRKIEATIILKSDEYVNFYSNPIYRRESGEVYLTSGSGCSFPGEDSLSSSGTTLEESYKETIDGKVTEKSFAVGITVRCEDVTDQYILKEMNEENELVKEYIIDVDHIPDEIVTLKTSAYMILEEIRNDEIYNRRLFNKGESIDIHFFDDSDFAKSYYISTQ